MTETHDLYLRALAVPVKKPKRQDKTTSKDNVNSESSVDEVDDEGTWPDYILATDTESRITIDQSLTFGVYRLCKLVCKPFEIHSHYEVIEEGIFYADDLPVKERKVLEAYMRTASSDVPSFPPSFPLYSRSEFMQKVFWRALKDLGASVCGFQLPYDLSRLALAWKKGDKGEWSLIMEQYPDGSENLNYSRILITPIDSKKAIITLALPCKRKLKKNAPAPAQQWKDAGEKIHFIDCRTMLWSLYNKSHTLKSATDNEKGPFKGQNLPQKDEHAPTGEVTPEEIEHCRQDVRCTVELLNACKREVDKHPDLDLKPWDAYSPASWAKSYLKAMGIVKPAPKFKTPDSTLGPWVQAYCGGRSESGARHEVPPVVPVDVASEYPSCCANLGLFNILTAESIEFVDDTQNFQEFLRGVDHEKCFERETWKQLNVVALVMPDDDILPVRTVYDGVTQNIGNNYLSANPANPKPVFMAGPDLVAAVIQSGTGKVPDVRRAFRIVPHRKQPGMRSVRLYGKVEINPYVDDIFTKIIEERKRHQDDEKLQYWLKILANSIYGFFVELIAEHFEKPKSVMVFSGDESFPDHSKVIERRGQWFAPYLATLIASAGRLLLAMLEVEVRSARGAYLYCDTDSLGIIASEDGGPLDIPGGEDKRVLKWQEVENIKTKFRALSPYDPDAVKELLNLTDDNYACKCSHELKEHDDSGICQISTCNCKARTKERRQLWGLSIAAKRYTLLEKLFDQNGKLINIKIINPKAHGIGYLYPPKENPKDWKKDAPLWVYEMWDYIARGFLGLERVLPSWASLPQMMRFSVSTWNVLKMLGMWDDVRPFNFMFMVSTDHLLSFDVDFENRPQKKPMVIVPFSSKQAEWNKLQGIDIRNKDPHGSYRRYRMDDPDFHPFTYGHMIEQYIRHPEAKSLGPDGKPCTAETRGLLQRAHITAGQIRYIDKETSSMWTHGDDLSVISDNDEVGFRVVEYGRSRKVVLPDSLKREIAETRLQRELRRRGIGQHTIERALHSKVRVQSYEKISAAIAEYKRETHKSEK
jgi:hypothetical protein